MNDPLRPRQSTAAELRAQEAMRRATVADAIDLLGRPVITVRADAPALEVSRLLTRHGQRTLPVVDEAGKLIGVIRAWDLVDSIFFRVMPSEFLSELLEQGGIERFRSVTSAGTAREAMSDAVAVRVDEQLTRAFHLIHANGIEGVPVINDRGEVVGHLDRLGILRLWVRLLGRELAHEAPGQDEDR